MLKFKKISKFELFIDVLTVVHNCRHLNKDIFLKNIKPILSLGKAFQEKKNWKLKYILKYIENVDYLNLFTQ